MMVDLRKGKESELKHFKNYASEKNDSSGGQASRDRPLPELQQDREHQRYEMSTTMFR